MVHYKMCSVYLERSKKLITEEPYDFNDWIQAHVVGHSNENHIVNSKERYKDESRFGPFPFLCVCVRS